MNEKDEMIGNARRAMEALMSKAVALREEMHRVAEMSEAAMGYENRMLGSAEQDLSCLLSCLRFAASGLETEAERDAAWERWASKA